MENSKKENLLGDVNQSQGSAEYFEDWMDREAADASFDRLLKTIAWERDVVNIFGKRIETERMTAWYGYRPYTYTYSKTTRKALPWTADLDKVLRKVSKTTGVKFNSCLLNLYHSGEEWMGWHSDDEKELVRDGVIASVSLGAERPFFFKNKTTKKKVEVLLGNGSLLVMSGAVQRYWLHSLPKRKKITKPRINLTFRMINESY